MTALRPGTPQSAGMRPEGIELIRQRAAEWVAQDNTLGLALVVARHGVVCLHEAWGRSGPEPDAPPVTTDSYFWYASITKSLVAVATLMLVEEGRLGLTRPVRFYVPEISAPGTEDILVQHLLTHTSGWDGDQTPEQIVAILGSGIDLPPEPDGTHPQIHARLQALGRISPHRKPGAQMSYNHENYLLLGEIIWRVSGMRWTEFVETRIAGPLGMESLRCAFDATVEAGLVWDFSKPVMPGWESEEMVRGVLSLPHPAGRSFGNALDCAKFAQMLLNEGSYGDAHVLHPASVAQMTRNQIPGIGTEFLGIWHDEASWGYGLQIVESQRWRWSNGTLPSRGAFQHLGAGGTAFWVDPAHDLIGVYLSRCLDISLDPPEVRWDYDLFQNLVTAAVADDG